MADSSNTRHDAAARAIFDAWNGNEALAYLRNVVPAEEGECRAFAEVALAAADFVERPAVEAKHEQEMLEIIDEREAYHDWADRLAYAIAPQSVIGEHSSGNNPWQNALDQLDAQHGSSPPVTAPHLYGSTDPNDWPKLIPLPVDAPAAKVLARADAVSGPAVERLVAALEGLVVWSDLVMGEMNAILGPEHAREEIAPKVARAALAEFGQQPTGDGE